MDLHAPGYLAAAIVSGMGLCLDVSAAASRSWSGRGPGSAGAARAGARQADLRRRYAYQAT